MNTIALDLRNSPEVVYVAFKFGDPRYADILEQYYRLRKEIFIDDLEWDLPHYNGLEIDQYDQETAEYVVALKDGECVGGCRMHPTTSRFKREGQTYTYMLRDAVDGKLKDFPTNVTFYSPVEPKIWELTRVISNKDPMGFRDLMWQVRMNLITRGVTDTLFITRPAIKKICSIWGYDITVTGPELSFGKMKAVAVKCNIENVKPHRGLAIQR